MRAHPQGCFVCYGRSPPFQHDHRTCSIHKTDTEAYKKAHGTKKRTAANTWEAKVEVSKDEIFKVLMVRTKLAKEIKESKRALGPRPDKDKDMEKEKKGKSGWRKKGDAVNEFAAEEDPPTTYAP